MQNTSSGFLKAAWFVGVLALLLFPSPAFAAVTPESGPAGGGTEVTIDGMSFVEVASGYAFTLGLTSQGTVYAWGSNSKGQLGDGTTNDSSSPVQVLAPGGEGVLSGVTAIAAGGYHSLALTPTGVFAWGLNDEGQLGNGTEVDSLFPVQVVGPAGVGFLAEASAIAAGREHSLAVTPTGVFAWGLNDEGQLGDGSTTSSSTPVQVRSAGGGGFLVGATSVAAGYAHSIAVSPNGVFAWGWNASGQLGDGTNTRRLTPVQVVGVSGSGGLNGVTQIAAGVGFSLALTPSGVFAWGLNTNGQLGNGTEGIASRSWIPVQVVGVDGTGFLAGAQSIAAGHYHSVAMTEAGVFTWGWNTHGQLGNGTITSSSLPVQVLGVEGDGFLDGVTQITAGYQFTIAATPEAVFGWGLNPRGQLGNGTEVNSLVPVLGANVQPQSVTFAGVAGSALSRNGSSWLVTTPSSTAGVATIEATANLFGGALPASPPTVTWSAGTFTFEAPLTPVPELAPTGGQTAPFVGLIAVLTLLLGAVTLAAHRRRDSIRH